MSDADYVTCDQCSCCIEWPGSTLEDQMTSVLVEKGRAEVERLDLPLAASCEDVLVYRGDDPSPSHETWCVHCIEGVKRRGVYTGDGRRSYGRKYERNAIYTTRVRLLKEDLK